MNNIQKMFDNLAIEYDFMNNIISVFLHKFVKKIVINEIKEGNILDLCTGTGDIAGMLSKKMKNSKIIGVDISDNMLNIARKKYKNVIFLNDNAENLHFENNYFDFVIVSFGYRNIQNKKIALNEIYRVLKPNGKFIHLDFGHRFFLYDLYINFVSNIFAKNKSSYIYLINSKNDFLKRNIIEDFKNAGFRIIKNKFLLFKMIKYEVMVK